jgi:hypothetical protein
LRVVSGFVEGIKIGGLSAADLMDGKIDNEVSVHVSGVHILLEADSPGEEVPPAPPSKQIKQSAKQAKQSSEQAKQSESTKRITALLNSLLQQGKIEFQNIHIRVQDRRPSADDDDAPSQLAFGVLIGARNQGQEEGDEGSTAAVEISGERLSVHKKLLLHKRLRCRIPRVYCDPQAVLLDTKERSAYASAKEMNTEELFVERMGESAALVESKQDAVKAALGAGSGQGCDHIFMLPSPCSLQFHLLSSGSGEPAAWILKELELTSECQMRIASTMQLRGLLRCFGWLIPAEMYSAVDSASLLLEKLLIVATQQKVAALLALLPDSPFFVEHFEATYLFAGREATGTTAPHPPKRASLRGAIPGRKSLLSRRASRRASARRSSHERRGSAPSPSLYASAAAIWGWVAGGSGSGEGEPRKQTRKSTQQKQRKPTQDWELAPGRQPEEAAGGSEDAI